MRRMTIAFIASLMLTATAAHAGDTNRGKIAFMRQCSACHVVIANTRDSIGPNLFGVVGRRAGSKPGYTYSDAMKSSGIVWSEVTLKSYVGSNGCGAAVQHDVRRHSQSHAGR